ncbi:hypothetical protein SCHPADRAFT_938407 [Schizopora paradoxa]|uniref:Uncharacterized protein n=1 Tax=Schizopora paradoxa TaxID=27342 RepID=A0A0H2RW20_9AGAM|nr:hypothetical protein SCHPADRAFT_938407 [Schizopora paradoxa]
MSSATFESVVEEEVRRLEVVHPTPDDIPGCMRLLDDFLSCHEIMTIRFARRTALGSQLKSLYRHGGQAVCGQKMEDFKFCMSLKAMDPEDKRRVWIRRRAEWWAGRRLGKSSEDVWDVRKTPLVNFPPKPLSSQDRQLEGDVEIIS